MFDCGSTSLDIFGEAQALLRQMPTTRPIANQIALVCGISFIDSVPLSQSLEMNGSQTLFRYFKHDQLLLDKILFI
jgi:hypothetical protein